MMGDPMANQATGALNADGLMSYAGDKPPTKFEQIISGAANFIPGIGMATKRNNQVPQINNQVPMLMILEE